MGEKCGTTFVKCCLRHQQKEGEMSPDGWDQGRLPGRCGNQADGWTGVPNVARMCYAGAKVPSRKVGPRGGGKGIVSVS